MPGAEALSYPGSGASARTGVLVVHGLTSTPQTMRPVAEHLGGLGYAVEAPRLPGHGTRWQDMARTRYADWFGVVEAAAVDLRGRVDGMLVVGLSLGGAMVSELAAGRPDLVDGVVLINPAFTATDPRLRVLPVLKHLLPTTSGLGDDIRRPGGEREICYDRLPLKAFGSFVAQWPRLLGLLGDVRQPVLLIRSAHDRVVPAASSQLLRDKVGSSSVTEVVLPDSGHVATLDHDADQLLAATAAFVAQVASEKPQEQPA